MEKRNLLRIVLLLAVLITTSSLVLAGPPPAGGPVPAPIDGGALALLAGAAAYAYRKVKKNKANKAEDEVL